MGNISSQLLLDVADFIYIAVDVNQKVSLINKKGCEILGYSEDEIIGKNWFDNFLPKEVAEDIKSNFVKRITKNKDTVLVNSSLVLTKEGEERLISWHDTFFKDEKGEINGVLCSGEDITEKHEMKVELRDSEEKFRVLFEEMNQAYALYEAVYDKRGKIKDATLVEVNREYEKLLNKKREDIIGKKISQILPKMKKQDDNPITLLRRTVIAGETVISEYFNKDLGKWLLAKSFSPIKNHAAILFEDVTEKHEMGVELIKSEEKFRILFEEMKQAYALYEAIYDEKGNPKDGIIVEVNPEYEKLVNKKREEVIGKKITEVYPRTQEQADNSINLLGKTLKTRETIFIEYYNETLGKWLSAKSFSPMKDYVAVLFEDITEKHNMEEELEEERGITKQYLDIANVMLIVIDTNENVSLVNKKGCDLLGYKQEEIIGKNWFNNFLPEKDREKMKEVFQHIMVGKISQSEYHENLILTKDGEERLIAWDNTYINDEDGTITNTLSSGKDITEIRKIEEKVKISEILYKALFDNTGSGMMLVEEDFTITIVNNLLLERSDRTQDEVIGKKWTDFVQKEERKNITEAIKRMTKNFVPPLTFETSNLNIFGDNKTLLITIGIIPETKQSIVSLIDITEQKELERELQANEEKYRELFNNIPIALSQTRPNGEIVECNSLFIELFGYEKAEELKKIHVQELYFDPNTRKEVLTIKNREGFYSSLLQKMKKKDGSPIWVDLNSKASYDENHEVTHYDSSLKDMTENREMEEKLIKSEKRLRNLFENIPLAISINSSDGVLMDINPAFWKLFEYSNKEECLSTPFTNRWFNIKDRERLYDSLHQRNFVYNFEAKRYKKGGSEFWGSITAIAQIGTIEERVYFTTVRDITTEKQKEEALKKQTLRYQLEESKLYLSEEESPYISKEAFSDLLRVGYNGLVLSRLSETEWKNDINYEFDFFRIAEKGHRKTISSELSKIEQLIEDLPNKYIIVIDRLDYIIAKNGFESTLFFIFRLMDIAYLSNHIIIVALDPTTISEKERKSLKKEMRMIKSIAEATLSEDLIEILELVHKKNITGDKPSYTDIVESFSISRPTARKRIKDLINEEYIFELTKGRNKVLGITAKGKAFFD